MIVMLGTDHTIAGVEERSALYVTKERRLEVMRRIQAAVDASGLVMLSTCNRMELWASIPHDDQEPDAFMRAFADEMGIDRETASSLFVLRTDDDAVEHLFHLACGLKSAIVAEDQVVTQVREALDFSREVHMSDAVLEVLFRSAVTAAKKVKTDVRFERADATAVASAISLLKSRGMDLSEMTCMVIGNGAYGKMAACEFKDCGASVMVTLRQYHHGRVSVPEGCRSVPYGERYEWIPSCDIVVSATASPHYTIVRDELVDVLAGKSIVLVDMAIPRDIDSACAEEPNVELYDIDDFQTGLENINHDSLARAEEILAEQVDEFWKWLARRDVQEEMHLAASWAAKNMELRVRKRIESLPLTREQKDDLVSYVSGAAGRMLNRAAYDLLEDLPPDQFERVAEALGSRKGT